MKYNERGGGEGLSGRKKKHATSLSKSMIVFISGTPICSKRSNWYYFVTMYSAHMYLKYDLILVDLRF